ncbi:hypothetical protein ScPMuIL_017070 [Solemya velum]
MLINIGFQEIMKAYDIHCFMFHDADVIPLDDRNIYKCSEQPTHLAAALDKFDYKLPYARYTGGAFAFTKQQFTEINGFSNIYFGWGREDDDLEIRLRASGYEIFRYPLDIARYTMLKHGRDVGNQNHLDNGIFLQSTKKCYKDQGLNSLKYTVTSVVKTKLFTWLNVFINKTEVMHQKESQACLEVSLSTKIEKLQ